MTAALTTAGAVLAVAAAVAAAVLVLLRPPADRRRTARAAAAEQVAAAAAPDDAALAADLVAAVLRGGLPVTAALLAVADICAVPAAHGQTGGARESSPGRSRTLPLGTALRLLAAEAAGAPAGHVDYPEPVLPLVEAVHFSAATGSPVAAALAQAAATARRRRRDAAVRAAGRLSASLVLPLGLCALPGFLLLGVAPVVVRLVGALA